MISSPPPAAAPVATDPIVVGRVRKAVLVAFVWTFAALPYVFGVMQCPTARVFRFPCPGCGMTRAFYLLADGSVSASLALHPLAVPTAVAQVVLAVASIGATLRFGAPWSLLRVRWGRAAVGLVAVVMTLDLLLWIARAIGAFGGPVPV